MPSDHQLHSVENANRRLREAALGMSYGAGGVPRDILVSSNGHEYTTVEIGKRATVIPERTFEFQVKHRIDMDKVILPETNTDRTNILGPVIENMIPVVTSQDPVSLMAAFNKRCNFIQAAKGDEIADTEFRSAIRLIRSLPNLFEPWSTNDTDTERWLAKFDTAKEQRMREALALLSQYDKRDRDNKTLMVKIETLLKRDDETWAPRAIYVGSDAHNCITGPAMMVAMERLCELVDEDKCGVPVGPAHCMFGYKKSGVQLMEHLLSDAKCRLGLEGDYSRNDREQRSRVAYIIDAWLEKLNFDPETRRFMLEASEEYDVYAPLCGLKATLKHQLPTGTTATTFRNSAFNLIMFAVAMQQQGVSNVRCVILGDDLLAASAQAVSCSEWQNCVDRFKMVLKAASPTLDGKATFLSRRLCTLSPRPCLVPKIGKALARFNCRASNNDAISDDAYMAGKSLAHAYEFRHAPYLRDLFLQRFAHHYPRSGLGPDGEIDHDSWFLKISGLTTPTMVITALEREQCLVEGDDWEMWIADTYEIGWIDLESLATEIITGTEYKAINTPLFEALSIDF